MINSFHGNNRFLSNFYLSDIKVGGIIFPSVENAYQAVKFPDYETRLAISKLTQGQAKREGKKAVLRSDWDRKTKFLVMKELLSKKFANIPLRTQLLDTNPEHLEEGNNWHDVIWGVCHGGCKKDKLFAHAPVGQNYLGKLLMEVRTTLY